MRIILEDPDGPGIFHPGEREAHRRFEVEALAREMQGTVADHLSAGNARFMAGSPFFFVSVREAGGAVFTQMLARVTTGQGTYPLLAFSDTRTFFFLLAESEGTRLLPLTQQRGCKAGMIFIDFARRARFRVNGELRQAGGEALPGFQCPTGYRLMEMRLEQAYANCQSRIVRLKAATS